MCDGVYMCDGVFVRDNTCLSLQTHHPCIQLAGAVLWAAVNELLLEPKEYKCFNLALDKLRHDPRVTVCHIHRVQQTFGCNDGRALPACL